MADVTITITGVAPLLRKLDAITADRTLRTAMNASLSMLQSDLQKYPKPPTAGSFPGFVSVKQRRYFFWALRSGRITVPYRRTGMLGRAWTSRITGRGLNMVGVIGNVMGKSYGRYVQDRQRQARIHQGRWATVQAVARRRRRAVVAEFQRAIRAAIQRG
jgi:hypothetical protein